MLGRPPLHKTIAGGCCRTHQLCLPPHQQTRPRTAPSKLYQQSLGCKSFFVGLWRFRLAAPSSQRATSSTSQPRDFPCWGSTQIREDARGKPSHDQYTQTHSGVSSRTSSERLSSGAWLVWQEKSVDPPVSFGGEGVKALPRPQSSPRRPQAM